MSTEPTRNDALADMDRRLRADLDRDALSQLVRAENDTGTSYQEMADRAARAGYPVSKPYLQKLGTNQVLTAPTPERLAGIAAALQKPVRIIQEAAAVQYLQYEPRELAGYGDELKIVVAHLAGMPESEVHRWRALIEADEKARRGPNSQESD
jgi:endonuclease/exonuclease/phosphatase family metal-dependent hydrolase